MTNNFDKLKRRLIYMNRRFIHEGLPVNNKRHTDVDITLAGNDIIGKIKEDKEKIFKDYNSKTKVLIKVNLNSSLPYPASVSVDIIEALITALKNYGVKRICISDCSGLDHLPTRKNMIKKKIFKLKKSGVKIKAFDYKRWVRIPIKGEFFNHLTLTKQIYKFDKIINLANLKSHSISGFSAATKNLVGFMHPLQRWDLHKNNLIEKVAELPLALIPDINIIDARKIFVDGGPDKGKTVEANTVIINSSIIQADIKAYNLLVHKKAENNIHDLPKNYMENIFFKHYAKFNGDSL